MVSQNHIILAIVHSEQIDSEITASRCFSLLTNGISFYILNKATPHDIVGREVTEKLFGDVIE